MPTSLPKTVFLSHGGPPLALADDAPARALRALGRDWPKPPVVIAVSPHWMPGGVQVKSPVRFDTWHDFGNFGPALQALRYDAPGNPDWAGRTVQALNAAGWAARTNTDARLDHGLWVPFSLLWPAADVPIVQVSMGPQDPRAHFALGQALTPLALIVGSGSFTHNLGELAWGDAEAAPEPWAQQFADWVAARLGSGDWEALFDYRRQAPYAARAHPSEEHFMPLFVAGGAAQGAPLRPLVQGWSFGNLSMAAYAA
jgi:4,5-DOPA dioxygenase extradiol